MTQGKRGLERGGGEHLTRELGGHPPAKKKKIVAYRKGKNLGGSPSFWLLGIGKKGLPHSPKGGTMTFRKGERGLVP